MRKLRERGRSGDVWLGCRFYHLGLLIGEHSPGEGDQRLHRLPASEGLAVGKQYVFSGWLLTHSCYDYYYTQLYKNPTHKFSTSLP